MMSPIFLELVLISSMVLTTWPTTWPPRCATWAALLAHRAGELAHRAGGLLEIGGGLLGALAQVGVAGGDLGTGGLDAVGAASHLGHHLVERVLHLAERALHVADLVPAVGGDARTQVAAADLLGLHHQLMQRCRDGLDQVAGDEGQHQHDESHYRGHAPDRAHALGTGRVAQFVGLGVLELDEILLCAEIAGDGRAYVLLQGLLGPLGIALALELGGRRARCDIRLARVGDARHGGLFIGLGGDAFEFLLQLGDARSGGLDVSLEGIRSAAVTGCQRGERAPGIGLGHAAPAQRQLELALLLLLGLLGNRLQMPRARGGYGGHQDHEHGHHHDRDPELGGDRE
jgi:hypothetical protein